MWVLSRDNSCICRFSNSYKNIKDNQVSPKDAIKKIGNNIYYMAGAYMFQVHCTFPKSL